MDQLDQYSTLSSTGDSTTANVLIVSGEIDATNPITELRLHDGRTIRIPTSTLLTQAHEHEVSTTNDEIIVIPVVEERLAVTTRTVPTCVVRIRKTVEHYTEALDEPLAVQTFDIERIVLNKVVDVAPDVRSEGDTTIYPVVEEQMVLTKQLVLKEEVHVTKRDSERRDTQIVILRRERILVEREPVS